MAKSNYSEKHSVAAEGILNIDDMTLEIENIGVKKLSDILHKFNGCNVKIAVLLGNDLK